jgi:CPA1 family monovalent cation:H+ antiporter
LGFPLGLRGALVLQRLFRIDRPLASQLADRFEILLVSETVVREVMADGGRTIAPLLGDDAWREAENLLRQRLADTEKALAALGLQYPEYARALRVRLLGQVALRIEDVDYRHMREDAAVSQEVFKDLERDLLRRSDALERRPVLDLGLEPEKLVARVPLFAELSAAGHKKIAKLLKPRFVLPGERLVTKNDPGDAMYFLSSGAVEVDVSPEPVQLGSGDFFGEIALVKDILRTADVTALGYCRCLVLYVKDFRDFLAANPAIAEKITRVAERRLAEIRPQRDVGTSNGA